MLIPRFLLVLFVLPITGPSIAQVSGDDASNADALARKYKEDDVMCMSSYHLYTFDKGKNALNEKVVTIQEDAELEFLSLKKFASLTYPEYYNRFIQLKTFKKAVKVGEKYITSARSGVDRSVTRDGVFF